MIEDHPLRNNNVIINFLIFFKSLTINMTNSCTLSYETGKISIVSVPIVNNVS